MECNVNLGPGGGAQSSVRLPYPLMSSVRVMPLMEALNVTMFIVDSPSVFSCSTVSLTTDSLPGPDTSTLPRYTNSHTA